MREAESRLIATLATGGPVAIARPIVTPPEIELEDVRLSPGSLAAITGASGAGKTTRLETLLGLRGGVETGIRVGGDDTATWPPQSLRRSFAWLPQDAMLLSGTIRNNLCLARPSADDATMGGPTRCGARRKRSRA